MQLLQIARSAGRAWNKISQLGFFPGSTYTVSACVGVSGPLQGSAEVLATLKLEYQATGTSYLVIGR